MSDPSCSLPCGGASVGGASSTCSEPNRLVCPNFTVALAGRSTSPSSDTVSSACQPCSSTFVTLPTVTSPTRTRELGCKLVTLGNSAWIAYEAGPPPAVPGSGNVFSPCQPQLEDPASATATPTPAA